MKIIPLEELKIGHVIYHPIPGLNGERACGEVTYIEPRTSGVSKNVKYIPYSRLDETSYADAASAQWIFRKEITIFEKEEGDLLKLGS